MKIVVTLAHHPTADRPDRLGMAELMSLLIACAAARLARSADEAIAAASAIGFPVALKIVSPDITHKAEAGGVVLGLPDGPAVRRATGAMFGRIATTHPAAVIHGVLVQSMAPAGPELFLSARRDEDRKPVISVDGALGPHGRTILNAAGVGATGHPGLDGLIGRVARLLVDRPDLVEIEIDPMIVGATGPLAVDARLGSTESGHGAERSPVPDRLLPGFRSGRARRTAHGRPERSAPPHAPRRRSVGRPVTRGRGARARDRESRQRAPGGDGPAHRIGGSAHRRLRARAADRPHRDGSARPAGKARRAARPSGQDRRGPGAASC